MITGDAGYSREDLFNFENKLRDIVQELTKPVYEKIGDTLGKIHKVLDKQADIEQTNKEMFLKIDFLNNQINKIEDMRKRTDTVHELVTNVQTATELKMSHVLEKFDKLNQAFDRSM